MNTIRASLVITVAAITTGCASDIIRSPAFLSPAEPPHARQIEIAAETSTRPSSGYSRVLPVGSIWQLRGTLPQGAVYRRADGIFTVEGAHVHEAYIVVSGDQLVGFYLPVEQAYSPAQPVLLKLK